MPWVCCIFGMFYYVSRFIVFGNMVYNDMIITGAEQEEAECEGDMLSKDIRFDESVVHFKGATAIVFFLNLDEQNS